MAPKSAHPQVAQGVPLSTTASVPPLNPVRGPRGLPGLGSLPAFGRDPLGFLTRLRDDFGDAVTWSLGTLRNLFVSHPGHIAELFAAREATFDLLEIGWGLEQITGKSVLRSKGADWRRKRALVQPVVRPRQVRAHASTMAECARTAADGWRDGQQIDLAGEMARITQRIVVRTLFGNDVGEQTGHLCEAIDTAVNAVGHELRSLGLFLPGWVRTPYRRRLLAAVATVDTEVHRLIRARLDSADAEHREDLLSRLLAAPGERGGPLSPREVRDEAVTLWAAGHETTSTALTWTVYLLSRAPGVRARLEAELSDVLGGRPPAADDYDRLVWTRQIVNEALRIYPPVWIVPVVAREGATLGGTPIRPGTVVWCSQWVTHRDRRWFPDPEAFRPERWDADTPHPVPDHAWFPFGGGPRGCLGARFAQVEATLVLATLAQRYRFHLPAAEVLPHAAMILRPSTPIRATLHQRTA